MKRLLISLILVAPLITGCAYVDTRVTLNDDRSASVVTSLTYKGNLADTTDTNAVNIAENYEKFVGSDYKVEKAYQDRLSTITATKSVRDLRKNDLDLSSLGFKTNLPSNKFIEIKKNFLITSYNIDSEFDPKAHSDDLLIMADKSEIENPKQTLVPEYYQKYGDLDELEPPVEREDDFAANIDEDTKQFVQDTVEDIDNKIAEEKQEEFHSSFSIKVPAFASYNNADNVEGNIYTWNIKKDEPTVIKLQYVKYSGAAIGIVLTLCVILLILFALRIRRHDAQKRVDNNDNIV